MTDYKKLYEDAIFRMNKWVEGSEIIDPKEVAEFVFPELKESEDERIRKAIHIYLDWLDGRNKDYQPKGDYSIKDMIAWLEKQGENHIVENNEMVYATSEQIPANSAKTCKDEQKHADKVEPKFKVGDWVVCNPELCFESPICIKDIDNNNYRVESVDGCSGVPTINYLDNYYHLFTIADVKDGDVLATNYFIFIFKNIDSNNGVHYYCQYEISKHEDDNQFDTALPESLMGKVGSTHYYPATKEQRDTLERAMTDAGYTFDFEKKELKKIDNEEVNGEDYGIDGLWHAQRILEKTLGSVDGYQSDKGILRHKCAISTVKKFYEQKPAFSEEDETVLNNLIYALANDIIGNCREEYVDWLKSLKDRI